MNDVNSKGYARNFLQDISRNYFRNQKNLGDLWEEMVHRKILDLGPNAGQK